MKRIPLTHGLYALVDDIDYNKLKDYPWCLVWKNKSNTVAYVSTRVSRKKTKMHHLILKKKDGYVVDHLDKNPLNNQRFNLRHLTISQNNLNRRIPINNTTGYTGIVYRAKTNRWLVNIGFNNRRIHIGSYLSFEEAKRARIDAEEKYFPRVNRVRDLKKKSEKIAPTNRRKYRYKLASSGYRCVYVRPSGNFSVIFHKDGKYKCLGTFTTVEEAAMRYIEYHKEILGEIPYQL